MIIRLLMLLILAVNAFACKQNADNNTGSNKEDEYTVEYDFQDPLWKKRWGS